MSIENIDSLLSEKEIHLASRKRRIAALVIDQILLELILFSIFILPGINKAVEEDADSFAMNMFTMLIVFFIVFLFKDAVGGVSPGRWMLNIKVVDADNPGTPPSLGRLVLRNAFFIIWPVEAIVCIANKNKERLGDRVAHTLVIEASRKPKRARGIVALVMVVFAFISIIGIAVSSMFKSSEPYQMAIQSIENNPEVLEYTGGIVGYGWMPSGSISTTNDNGRAYFSINVKGEVDDVIVHVEYIKDLTTSGQWQMVSFKVL